MRYLAPLALTVLSLSAGAQVPQALQGNGTSADEARASLETLLACKAGTRIVPATVDAQFAALGLVQGLDGFMVPARGNRVSLLGGDVLAAMASVADNEHKVIVYLRGAKTSVLAKRFGTRQINEWADTDEPSYFRDTGKGASVLVFAPTEISYGSQSLKSDAAVGCRVVGADARRK